MLRNIFLFLLIVLCLSAYSGTNDRINSKTDDGSVVYAMSSVSESEAVVVEINPTNFPDDKFRQYLLTQDYGADGKLTEYEILSVRGLVVSGMNIRSLIGIEYFNALDHLFCDENQLTSIDVSNLTALKRFSCKKIN